MPPAPTVSQPQREGARLALLPHEVALVLDCNEDEIVELVHSGCLVNVSRDRHVRVAATQFASLVSERMGRGELGPLAAFVFEEIVAGRVEVPRRIGDRFGFVLTHLRRGIGR